MRLEHIDIPDPLAELVHRFYPHLTWSEVVGRGLRSLLGSMELPQRPPHRERHRLHDEIDVGEDGQRTVHRTDAVEDISTGELELQNFDVDIPTPQHHA